MKVYWGFIMSEIAAIHYISQDTIPGKEELELIEQACIGGADWIQLRIKDQPEKEVLLRAVRAKELCERYKARLIINDFPRVAAEVEAYGLHLGKNDMDPSEARNIVGNTMIIGGTANTLEEVEYLTKKNVNYIGYGPFRYTTTKKNLSPVVGLEGYQRLSAFCSRKGIQIPVIAIGGILPDDIEAIMATGVAGVAISSVINTSEDPAKAMKFFAEKFQMIQERLSKEI